jgi:hypothetical protein
LRLSLTAIGILGRDLPPTSHLAAIAPKHHEPFPATGQGRALSKPRQVINPVRGSRADVPRMAHLLAFARAPQSAQVDHPGVPSLLGRVVVKRFQTSSTGPVVMSVGGSALLFGIGTEALPWSILRQPTCDRSFRLIPKHYARARGHEPCGAPHIQTHVSIARAEFSIRSPVRSAGAALTRSRALPRYSSRAAGLSHRTPCIP